MWLRQITSDSFAYWQSPCSDKILKRCIAPYRLRPLGDDIMTVVECSQEDDAARRRVLLAVAVFANLLFFATWGLWNPASGEWTVDHSSFPRIPLMSFAGNVPAWLEYVLLATTIVATWTLVLSRSRKGEYPSLACFLVGAVSLTLIDQHRLQPWLYLFGILCVFALLLDSKQFVVYSRWLLISIYVFSAWSKLDHTFAHTLGQQFIDTLWTPFRNAGLLLDKQTRTAVAFLFPLIEGLIGVGLVWNRTRKVSTIAAVSLHVCLLAILGPWGLGHNAGVLIWNLFFVVMLWILFRNMEWSKDPGELKPNQVRWRPWVVAIILTPLLEPLGLLDHWPAWQVYAPRNSRVTMEIRANALGKLPADLTPFLREDESSAWANVDLDALSLVRLSAPNYPQDRFQLGVALSLAKRYELGDDVRVTLRGIANRFDGSREQELLRGVPDIETAATRFQLNALPPIE